MQHPPRTMRITLQRDARCGWLRSGEAVTNKRLLNLAKLGPRRNRHLPEVTRGVVLTRDAHYPAHLAGTDK